MSLQKRARSSSLSSLSSASPPPTSTRKRAKLETRECPICSELIPVRLLQKHTIFESQRVDRIIDSIGSTEVLHDDLEEGTQRRRSAIRAQKSISSTPDTQLQTTKTLRSIKKNRKKRYAGLREMAKEIEEGYIPRAGAGPSRHSIVCPVCLGTVSGDQDVLDAHVDACLADASRKLEEERQRAEEDEWEDVLDETIVGNVRGTGFHTRDRNEQDVEEEIDVDGDDDAFGCAQFTEGDILPLAAPPPHQDVEVDIENDDDEADETLRDLVAAGKTKKGKGRTQEGLDAVKAKMDEVMGIGDTDRMDLAILAAKKSGSKSALVSALEEKVKHLEASRVSATTSLLCRICLDPYNEPTVSTGCWHTCCRECWLRCLGSTKLCPICKRITGATDLRRVYL
ncbi:hypothetical protein BDZ89DRAFT_1063696 [Hymenopellis radicata]|nr:hypothetical protein BDZ89DRAFT_1063696 [Hymenopellis radicata]